MNYIDLYITAAISLPFLCGLIALILFKFERLRNVVLAIGFSISLLLYFLLFTKLPLRPGLEVKFFSEKARPLLFYDGLALLLAFLFTLVALTVLLYSFWYMKGQEHLREFYFFFPLLLTAVCGAVFAAHLIFIYVFWEIATIGTWRLVGFYRKEEHQRAAVKTFLIIFFGSSFMVAAMGILYSSTSTLSLYELKGAGFAAAAVVTIMLAIAAKSALMPLHTWLEDAYPAAPVPINAFLSAAVEKLGLILFLRLFVMTGAISKGWLIFIAYLAVFSSIMAAGVALVEKDARKILAASTISQLSFIFLGLVAYNFTGLVGAVLYILSHSLAKSGLFLSLGIVEKEAGERNLDKLGGLMKGFPVTAFAFALLALSIVGVPPLIGFSSKLMILLSCFKSGIAVLALAVAAASMTLLYMGRLFNGLFVGSERTGTREKGVAPYYPLFLGVLSLIIGILPSIPVSLIEKAVRG